ncbi:MAG TPA: helix-turn-helix transcriptional regulator [Streptosporangiaceae bacterium]|nr:helix-turn-helix transcriptional regulator [Streptosporangiaceae bacterium]
MRDEWNRRTGGGTQLTHTSDSRLPGENTGVLTPRQAQVVRLAAAGMTAKETARRLGISKNTVDEYIRDAKRRVKASTKAELTAWATMTGIADNQPRS